MKKFFYLLICILCFACNPGKPDQLVLKRAEVLDIKRDDESEYHLLIKYEDGLVESLADVQCAVHMGNFKPCADMPFVKWDNGNYSGTLEDAGFVLDNHYYSEIDKHAIANYKYNFKNAKYIGSVTDVRAGRGNPKIKQPHVITFGSPCQDFSLAGKRKGMEGQRSSLILHAIRLIREFRPNFFIWENVKGTFSSNDGADFWAIISAFANIGGYRLEWQLLNTSWFLPQNRERIYLIGHLAGSKTNFKGVFPIQESSSLHHKGEQKKSGKLASTLNAGDNKSWVGNFVCVASRGRNPDNPSDRTTGMPTQQILEPNSQGTTNTLTSVDKDNLIAEIQPTVESGTWRTHKDGQGFRKVQNGDIPTIPARARQDGSRQPVIRVNDSIHGEIYLPKFSNIRRLTEIECERLQGFPDDWTKFGNYEGKIKEIPKTQRYKMLGNAVTVNVVKAIGERLILNK